jgi:hypothetical protein
MSEGAALALLVVIAAIIVGRRNALARIVLTMAGGFVASFIVGVLAILALVALFYKPLQPSEHPTVETPQVERVEPSRPFEAASTPRACRRGRKNYPAAGDGFCPFL